MATDPKPADLVEGAWVRVLSRRPSDAERKPFEEMLTAAKPDEQRQIVEDMYWSLLTSREFLFRH
jgi:predicted nucleotidyltransferase